MKITFHCLKAVSFSIATLLVSSSVLYSAESRSTNIKVDSSDLEPFSIDKHTDPEGKPVIYSDGQVAVGFNDDGDPNVATRF